MPNSKARGMVSKHESVSLKPWIQTRRGPTSMSRRGGVRNGTPAWAPCLVDAYAWLFFQQPRAVLCLSPKCPVPPERISSGVLNPSGIELGICSPCGADPGSMRGRPARPEERSVSMLRKAAGVLDRSSPWPKPSSTDRRGLTHSVGSSGHAAGLCRPCVYVRSSAGCKFGASGECL